jgi:NADH-quinone oxidoreductase subunit L
MTYMSRVVKAGQSGITQTYLFVFAAGIMIIVMLLFL